MAKISTQQIGIQMKIIRQQKGITQEVLAEELNISQSSYAKLESGHTQITAERLQEIAVVLSVPLAEFIVPTELFQKVQLNSLKGEKIKYFQVDGRRLLKEKNIRIKELELEVKYLRKLLKKELKVKLN